MSLILHVLASLKARLASARNARAWRKMCAKQAEEHYAAARHKTFEDFVHAVKQD